MLASPEEVMRSVRERLGRGMKIVRVGDGLIFEHRNAAYFLAEVDLKAAKISVPVTAEFRDHLEYDGDELISHAMDELKPRLDIYAERGYRIREVEWQPAQRVSSYDDRNIPVFVAFVERELEDWDELFEELIWLLDRLPQR